MTLNFLKPVTHRDHCEEDYISPAPLLEEAETYVTSSGTSSGAINEL